MACEILRCLNHDQLAAVLAHRDFFTDAHLVTRNVHLPPVDRDVTVANQLARLAARLCEAKSEHNVVETTLQLLQQQFARDALGASSLLEVIAELAFLGEVDSFCFLLLTQLKTVADDFCLSVAAMLAGSEITLFHRTLLGETLCALKEQLHSFAAAKTTNCIFITCQLFVSLTFSVAERFTGG